MAQGSSSNWMGHAHAIPKTPGLAFTTGGMHDEAEDEERGDPRSSSPPLTSPTPAYHYQSSYSPFFANSASSCHSSAGTPRPTPPQPRFSIGTTTLPPSSRDRAQRQSPAPANGSSHSPQHDVSLKDQMWKEKFRQRCLKGPRWSLGGGAGGSRGTSGDGTGGRVKNGKKSAGAGNSGGLADMGGDGIASGSRGLGRERRSASAPFKAARNPNPSASTKRSPHPNSLPTSDHDLRSASSSDEEEDPIAQAENEEIFRRLMLKQNRVERHKVDVSYEREVGSLWSDPVALEEEIRLAGMEGDEFQDEAEWGANRDWGNATGGRYGDGRGEYRNHTGTISDDDIPDEAEEWVEEELRRLEGEEEEMEAAALQAYMESSGRQDSRAASAQIGPAYSGLEEDMQGIDWDEVLADDGLSLSGDEGEDVMPDLGRNESMNYGLEGDVDMA